MAGKQHTFLVSFIAGKLQKRNYRIIYLDGKYVDCLIEKPEIPPTVINWIFRSILTPSNPVVEA
jgi:hypothetical protein